jgi:hypothetical protein
MPYTHVNLGMATSYKDDCSILTFRQSFTPPHLIPYHLTSVAHTAMFNDLRINL